MQSLRQALMLELEISSVDITISSFGAYLAILLSVLLGPLEDVGALLLTSGTLVQGSLLALSTGSCLPLTALQDGLRDGGKFLVWHSKTKIKPVQPRTCTINCLGNSRVTKSLVRPEQSGFCLIVGLMTKILADDEQNEKQIQALTLSAIFSTFDTNFVVIKPANI